MPYIEQHVRKGIDDQLNGIGIDSSGELNYCITKLCNNYLSTFGKRYIYLNDIIGALENAKLEFYRRVVVPYEDEKCKQNGDVYGI